VTAVRDQERANSGQSGRSAEPEHGTALRTLTRDGVKRRLLALADALAAAVVSVSLAVGAGEADDAFWAFVLLPTWLLLAKLYGLYDRDHRTLRHLTVDELPTIVIWAMTGTAVISLLLLLTPAGPVSFAGALQMFAVAIVTTALLRGVARFAWRLLTAKERVLLVGAEPLLTATRRKLELFPDIHARVVAEEPPEDARRLLREPERLAGVGRIVLAAPAIDETMIAELVSFCRSAQVKLTVVPPARGMFGTAVQLKHIADLPVVDYNTWHVSRSTLSLKRGFDVVGAALAVALLAPLGLLIAVAIVVESRGGVFFVQTRAGLLGHPFRMLKFRTMVQDAEALLPRVVAIDDLSEPMFKLARDPRVTRVGRVLRRTSLDELPQLLNVLKGDMSLVGPRPEQVDLVGRYLPEHRFRLDLKPGLTGPMQVYGRGELTFDERLAVEREYVENLTLGRDVRILALTLVAVISGRGAY
jgi:exopolysaccharide biosynthesis polyprenyl glycosylphosphotransferase